MDRRNFLGILGGLIAVPQFGRWHRQGSGLLVPAVEDFLVGGSVRLHGGTWQHRKVRLPADAFMNEDGTQRLFDIANALVPDRGLVPAEFDDLYVLRGSATELLEGFRIEVITPTESYSPHTQIWT